MFTFDSLRLFSVLLSIGFGCGAIGAVCAYFVGWNRGWDARGKADMEMVSGLLQDKPV
jgi:hypothetical protein